jgi:hypothetical protein
MEEFKITSEIIKDEVAKIRKKYNEVLGLFRNKDDDLLKHHISVNCVTDLKKKISDKKGKYLYIISAKSFPFGGKGAKRKIEKIFEELRDSYGMSRINDVDQWENVRKDESLCLYVGSSNGIISRIKDHWGEGAKGTYALHLKEWWKNDIQKEIVVDIWYLSPIIGGERQDYLQIIEDIVWEKYKPLFGKKGTK